MGQHIPFAEQNFNDLPAYRHDGETISCWRLSWGERVRVVFGGCVWLRVQDDHPPVSLAGHTPFLSGQA